MDLTEEQKNLQIIIQTVDDKDLCFLGGCFVVVVVLNLILCELLSGRILHSLAIYLCLAHAYTIGQFSKAGLHE